MKRMVCMLAPLLVSGLLLAAAAQQQSSAPSLADAARRARAAKQPVPASRVFTNENLPTQGSISTNTDDNLPKGTSDQAAAAPGEAGSKAEGAAAPEKEKDPAALQQEWRKKIGDQKAKVAQLQSDVNRIEREMKMQGTIAAFGNSDCLNFPQKCADSMKAYQDELASKQQQLQAETDQLDNLREELRRGGLPAAWGD